MANNKVLSPAVVANTSTLVSSLIDQTNRVWKGEIIESYFFEWEAKIIKNIPLCRSIQEDVLIWPFSPDGEYTVQTGYRFLQKQHLDNEPGSSEAAELKSLWKKIWGLKVPGKVRNLVWRACKNALPTKMNLLHRKVVTSAVCELCNLHTEDPAHALYHCPKLETLWQSTPLWGHSTIKQCSSFLDIMFVVCADDRDPELFSAMAWTLWNRRNNLRLGKPAVPLEQVLHRARDLKLGCLSAPTSVTAVPEQKKTAWTPPPVHGYKVNFDGALFEHEDSAGLGVVIRNQDGLVMASLSEVTPLPSTVIEVETLAARRAVEFALELGFENIILEGDSEILIKILNRSSRSLASFGHIINDINFLASRFACFSAIHVKRHCNRVAHSLARRALSFYPLSVWMEDVPPELLSVLQADLNSLP